jgi:hypothetical protein
VCDKNVTGNIVLLSFTRILTQQVRTDWPESPRSGPASAREAGDSLLAHGPALRDGKGSRQAEQAREVGDRNLAAFSIARFAGSSGDDLIDILTSTSRTPVDSRA